MTHDSTSDGTGPPAVGPAMVAHAVVHTYELSLPILVTIWLAEFGVTAALVGAVLAAAYGLFGLGALPGGALADTYGPRRLIAASLAGMGFAFLALSVAPAFPAVAVAVVFWGLAASLYHPAGLSLVSGRIERGSALAYHGIAGNVGIAAGPLATALLLLAFDWRAVVALLALPALAVAGYVLAIRPPRDETVPATADVPATDGGTLLAGALADARATLSGAFVAVFVAVMLYGLYYRGTVTFLPEMIGALPAFAPVEVAGRAVAPERYFYAGLLAVGALGQYVGGRLVDRVPTTTGLAAAFAALAALALVFLPIVSLGLVPALAAGAALGFALFLVQPFYQAAVAEGTAAGRRGVAYGYTYAGLFGIGALGGALAGAILTYASPAALFVVLSGLAAAGAVATVALSRASRGG